MVQVAVPVAQVVEICELVSRPSDSQLVGQNGLPDSS